MYNWPTMQNANTTMDTWKKHLKYSTKKADTTIEIVKGKWPKDFLRQRLSGCAIEAQV